MADIKETKELVVGVNELALVLLKHLKDGFQLSKDLPAIFAEMVSNDEIQSKLQAAYEGISKVSEEVKDLNLQEGVELGLVQIEYVQKIIDSLKKADA